MIGNLFKLVENLGSGGFGEIWKCINIETNEELAIKLETIESENPRLIHEATIYKYFMKHSIIPEGICNSHYFDSEGEFYFLILDLLGPNLNDLFDKCNKKFNLKTVLMLADQMITRIEYIHDMGFLHRDIKPNNFVIGNNKNSHIIYLIDFGLSKKYVYKTGKHVPYLENQTFVGNSIFASINTHRGIDQSRRDDLESLGYVFLFFLKGDLPWQSLVPDREKIKEKKLVTSVEELCEGCPLEFATYLTYCRNLKFDENPDYDYLRIMLQNVMKKLGLECDFKYEWTSILEENKKITSIKTPILPIELEDSKQEEIMMNKN